MEKTSIVDEAKSLLEQLENQKSRIDALIAQNSTLKKLLAERTKGLETTSEKNDELLRKLVFNDKKVADLSSAVDEKNQSIDALLQYVKNEKEEKNARDESIEEAKSAISSRAGLLEKENSELKEKLNSFIASLSAHKKALKNYNEKMIQMKSIFDKKSELMENERKNSETRLAKQSNAIQQSVLRINALEAINRKLMIQMQQEKEIAKKMSQKPDFFRQSSLIGNEFESKEIISMIKIAMDRGDSIENIRASLINSGYEENKIEKNIQALKRA